MHWLKYFFVSIVALTLSVGAPAFGDVGEKELSYEEMATPDIDFSEVDSAAAVLAPSVGVQVTQAIFLVKKISKSCLKRAGFLIDWRKAYLSNLKSVGKLERGKRPLA